MADAVCHIIWAQLIKDLNDLMTTSWDAVRTPEFMKATKDIDTLLGWEATRINRADKTVEVKEVKSAEVKILPYDKLVIATGAENFKPPMENINATGVFGMKTPKDAVDMQNYIKTEGVESAVVIGAGLIGMECAEAFANWGLDVTIIEMQGSIFPQVLDAEMGAVVPELSGRRRSELHAEHQSGKNLGQRRRQSVRRTDR